VLIADPHLGIAEAISHYLAADFFVTPPVQALGFLIGILAIVKVDVVLAEIDLPDGNFLEALPALVGSNRDTRFVLYTSADNHLVRSVATERGARGVVHKSTNLRDLAKLIRAAWADKSGDLSGLVTGPRHRVHCRAGDWAPTREKVQWLLRAGLSRADVARALEIGEKDVQYQCRELRRTGELPPGRPAGLTERL